MQLNADDDIEAFLGMFERVAKRAGRPHRVWASIITPLFTGKAQEAYHALTLIDTEEYYILKEKILACCRLTSTEAA